MLLQIWESSLCLTLPLHPHRERESKHACPMTRSTDYTEGTPDHSWDRTCVGSTKGEAVPFQP